MASPFSSFLLKQAPQTGSGWPAPRTSFIGFARPLGLVLLWRMRASGSRRGRARSSFDALAVGVSAEDTFLWVG